MVDTSFQKFARKALKKDLMKWSINIALIPPTIPLLIARYLFRIKFFRVHGSRFGHLAMNNEIFLRRKQLGLLKEKKVNYIGIAPTSVCNQRLVNMLKRKLTIIQIPQPRFLRTITKIMAEKSILSKWDLFVTFPYDVGYFPTFHEAKPSLSFTEEEEQEGRELLQKMNITSWFVSLHVRDSIYVSQILKRGDSRYTYRNSSIENFILASDYLTKQGAHVVRMGAKVQEKMPEQHNQKIIDYSTLYRTELGDIYLPAKCKFFLGTGSGVASIAEMFNVPTILTNVIPLSPLIPSGQIAHFPPGKHDLFIPKKIWSVKKKRHLTFKEEIAFDHNCSFDTEDYEKEGLVPIENTSEEILAVAQEMNQRLTDTWRSTGEDEELQRKFKALFKQGSKDYQFSARLGAHFLRENKHLLE